MVPMLPELPNGLPLLAHQPEGVGVGSRIVANGAVQVGVTTPEPDRVIAQEATDGRSVVPCPIIILPGSRIPFSPRILEPVAVARVRLAQYHAERAVRERV